MREASKESAETRNLNNNGTEISTKKRAEGGDD